MISCVVQYGDLDDFIAELKGRARLIALPPVRIEHSINRTAGTAFEGFVVLAFRATDELHVLHFSVARLTIPQEAAALVHGPTDFEKIGIEADYSSLLTRVQQVDEYLKGVIEELAIGAEVLRGRMTPHFEYQRLTAGWDRVHEEAPWIVAPLS